MKKDRYKEVSEFINARFKDELIRLGKLDISEAEWANICDRIADDVITKLDDMEEDETDL